MKAPLPATEPERLEALASYDILDTPSEPAFDDLTRAARDITGRRHAEEELRRYARELEQLARDGQLQDCGTLFASLAEQTRRLEGSLSTFAGKQE